MFKGLLYIKKKLLKKSMAVFHLVHLHLAYKNECLYYTSKDFKAHYNTNIVGQVLLSLFTGTDEAQARGHDVTKWQDQDRIPPL